jgi:2-haloacid dehalogenase
LEKIWLVSGNPFDVVGARSVGMRAAWVDRGGRGWCDGLGGLLDDGNGKGLGPIIIVGGVDEAVKGIESWEKRNKEA